MRVFDCFNFFNELELLEVRLKELDPIIDIFVIAESELTFKGKPKELYFHNYRERFSRYASKIRHIVIRDNPDTDDPWIRQEHQRECLRRGFFDAAPDDIVMISDLDEIPSRSGVRRAIAAGGIRYLETQLFYQSLNLMTESGRTWTATFAGPRSEIDALPNFTDVRRSRCTNGAPRDRVIPHAGWHFSSVGGVEALQTKLSAISENSPEVLAMNNTPYLAKHIEDRILFFSGEKLVPVSPLENFPLAIMEDPNRYHRLGLLTDDYRQAPPFEPAT